MYISITDLNRTFCVMYLVNEAFLFCFYFLFSVKGFVWFNVEVYF